MKIYVIVEYEDVEVFGVYGDVDYVTKTEVLQAYGNKQDAYIECKHLNSSNNDDCIQFDVIETELY